MKWITNWIVAFLVLSMSTSCMIIRQGEVGVKRKYGLISETALTPGARGYNPLSSVIIRVPVRTVNLEVKVPLPSKEGLTINSEISILYRVSAKSAPLLLREVGLGYEREMIMPVFRSAVADVSARFLAKDMHSGARAAIEGEIASRMNEILEKRGIIIENVLMKSIQLPPGLARAIEEKLEAEQDAQRMEFVKQREQADAERLLIQTKGQREAQLIAADAEKQTLEIRAAGQANATRLEAEAQAAANDMLQKSLSPEVLKLRAINAFQEVSNSQGSKLIITNGSTPFLGLPEDLLRK
jgi:regulator of protease activity HflC (stomatin/prohibitin superfamily)